MYIQVMLPYNLTLRYPQALRDRLKVMAAKSDVPQPVTPKPNRLKLGGSVRCGCSRSEVSRSREVCCIFWRGVGGDMNHQFSEMPHVDPCPCGIPQVQELCIASISGFVVCHARETVAEHHEGNVLDCSHKCPTDTLTRSGCALP